MIILLVLAIILDISCLVSLLAMTNKEEEKVLRQPVTAESKFVNA